MRFRRNVGRFGPFWKGVIFDREYKNLDDIVSRGNRLFTMFGDGVKWHAAKSDYKWTWPTGEELLIRSIKKSEDYGNFHGQEFPFIGWNELTKFPTSELYDKMMSCNRCGRPDVPLWVHSTTNPSGCVPFGEVLTEDGWVPIEQVRPGDIVISCDDAGNLSKRVCAAVVKKNWSGDMVSRIGSGLHMVFTDDHRFPHLNTDRTKHFVKSFKELPGEAIIRRSGKNWVGEHPDTILGYESGDFMELLGWFVSEGCMVRREDFSERNSFSIAQMKPNNRARIEDLLNRMGIHFRKDAVQFTCTNREIADLFRRQGRCTTKHIPRQFMDLSVELLTRLYEALMLGDGSDRTYYTTSRQLCDDVCEILTKLGKPAFVHTRLRKNRTKRCYEIRTSNRTTIAMHTGNHRYSVETTDSSVNVSKSKFSGTVYCLTVPGTETFFIRQNGCVWLSGNSGHAWVKKRFIDPAPAGKLIRVVTNAFNPQTQQYEDIVTTRVRIFSSYKENPYLSPKYIASLENISDDNLKKAWLYGDWDVQGGGALDDVWGAWNIVPRFRIPESWRIDRSFDWGSTHPFSIGWWAQASGEECVLPDGRRWAPPKNSLFRIFEIYGTEEIGTNRGLKMPAAEIADLVAKYDQLLFDKGWIQTGVNPGPADNQIDNVTEADTWTIAHKMADRGITWTTSDKSRGARYNGLELFRQMLVNARNGEGPGIFFMDHCKAALETLPILPRDDDDPDDVDTAAEDHLYDECRYRILAGANNVVSDIPTHYPR